MKKLFTILVPMVIGILFFATMFAQAPQKMSYQAVIRDANNNLVTSQAVGMKITILQNTRPVYTETQTPTTNTNGLVTIEIGGGTGFETIDWANGSYFIKTEIDPTGGTTYSISGTSQLLSVPYALNAKAITLRVSSTGDTLYTGSGQHIIIPGISAANPQITDIDGNTYATLTLGTQTWMAENLKTTKYNDNTAIPYVTDGTAWGALATPAYCWFNNDAATYKATYGAMYNWYTVNTGKLCPTGWHVPTIAEWDTLIIYLGGTSVAGGKLKETGTANWNSPNTGATNETGFTALPGGYRTYGTGRFDSFGQYCNFWSSTSNTSSTAWDCYMNYNYSDAVKGPDPNKRIGFSVRCLKNY